MALFSQTTDIFHGTPNAFDTIILPDKLDPSLILDGRDEYGIGFYGAIDPSNPAAAQAYARTYQKDLGGVVLGGKMQEGKFAFLNVNEPLGEDLAAKLKNNFENVRSGDPILDQHYNNLAGKITPDMSGKALWNRANNVQSYVGLHDNANTIKIDPDSFDDSLRAAGRSFYKRADALEGASDSPIGETAIHDVKNLIRNTPSADPHVKLYLNNLADNITPETKWGNLERSVFNSEVATSEVKALLKKDIPAVDRQAIAGEMDKQVTRVLNETGVDGLYIPDAQTAVFKGKGVEKIPDLYVNEVVGGGPKNASIPIRQGQLLVPSAESRANGSGQQQEMQQQQFQAARDPNAVAAQAAQQAEHPSAPAAPSTASAPTTPTSPTPPAPTSPATPTTPAAPAPSEPAPETAHAGATAASAGAGEEAGLAAAARKASTLAKLGAAGAAVASPLMGAGQGAYDAYKQGEGAGGIASAAGKGAVEGMAPGLATGYADVRNAPDNTHAALNAASDAGSTVAFAAGVGALAVASPVVAGVAVGAGAVAGVAGVTKMAIDGAKENQEHLKTQLSGTELARQLQDHSSEPYKQLASQYSAEYAHQTEKLHGHLPPGMARTADAYVQNRMTQTIEESARAGDMVATGVARAPTSPAAPDPSKPDLVASAAPPHPFAGMVPPGLMKTAQAQVGDSMAHHDDGHPPTPMAIASAPTQNQSASRAG